ncbi:MAG: hypothetical protein AB4426_18420 [Xenococcaceae cyanobacterium]
MADVTAKTLAEEVVEKVEDMGEKIEEGDSKPELSEDGGQKLQDNPEGLTKEAKYIIRTVLSLAVLFVVF